MVDSIKQAFTLPKDKIKKFSELREYCYLVRNLRLEVCKDLQESVFPSLWLLQLQSYTQLRSTNQLAGV